MTDTRAALLERLASKRPHVATVRVLLDPDLADAVTDATTAVTTAKLADGDVGAAELRLEQARAAADAATVVLRFAAVPSAVFDRLLAEHPATEAQRARGESIDAERLAPVLIAAASLDGLTEAEATAIMTGRNADGQANGWASAESALVYAAAFGVNQRTSHVTIT